MDALARYVSEKNVANFVAYLRIELDPEKRILLERLLSVEILRFGSQQDRLHLVDQNLREGETRIAHQRRTVDSAMADEADPCGAERELNNLLAIEELFLSLRERILRDAQASSGEFGES